MLKRNLLKAGDYVGLIPVGIKVTLQYKPTGVLDRVWLGYAVGLDKSIPEDSHYSKNLFSEFMKNSKVPAHINTNRGSLFVQGVIYTSKHSYALGDIESEIEKDLINEITKNNVEFNFFAANVISTTIKFAGVSQIRNWLKVQGFNVIPGTLVPLKNVESSIKKSLAPNAFEYDLLQGYMVFDRSGAQYISLHKYQDSIDAIDVYLDSEGSVRSNIYFKNSKTSISISYYEMVVKQLYEGDFVILDENNKVISKYPIPKQLVSKATYTCPFCGKVYVVSDEFSKCPDSHCTSRMYSAISHFLSRLNLPNLEYSRYIELVQNNELTKFSDVLLLDELKNAEIELTFYDLLDAIIPVSAVRNRDEIWKLCTGCNNSWESISYYLEHPISIEKDLKFTAKNLINWLSDKTNVSDVKEIMQFTNIVITSAVKKFEGSPIFRGKNIWITGKFTHGSNAEVEAILRSYSAQITNPDEADCCIIGDIPENVDGGKVTKLKNLNKPIFSESEFFSRYDIDSDLR